MNHRRTFMIQNTIFGLFIGLSFIIASYAFHLSGKTISLNPQLNNVLLLLSFVGVFIGVRKYREEHLEGIMSYAKALGNSIYLLAIAFILYGIYLYMLYKSQPELQENYLQITSNMLEEIYQGSPLLENMKTLLHSFMTPGMIAFTEVFNNIFFGFIFSLFLAGILRRKKQI